MIEQNIVTNYKINLNVLSISQFEIINLYNQALNIENIRNLLIFMCRSKGMLPYLEEDNSSFFVSLDRYKKNCPSHVKENIQADYNNAVIYLVKRMLTAYHKKKLLKIGFWFEKQKSFDPQCLTRKELGILTKILKLENKRLKKIGIKNRRQKEAYYHNIFLASYE